MIEIHIINLIQLLVIVIFIAYYIGKGKITIQMRMSKEEEEKIKKQQEELEDKINSQISVIQNFNDGLD